MYVSLTKLSQEEGPAGELASFHLSKTVNPENDAVKTIIKNFNTSFNVFKADKEVAKVLSVAERYRNEGWTDGAIKTVELIKSGLSPDEALRKVLEEKNSLAEPITIS